MYYYKTFNSFEDETTTAQSVGDHSSILSIPLRMKLLIANKDELPLFPFNSFEDETYEKVSNISIYNHTFNSFEDETYMQKSKTQKKETFNSFEDETLTVWVGGRGVRI